MAKPLVALETIYETALDLLRREGEDALTARRLAAEIGCSVRTLYEQVSDLQQTLARKQESGGQLTDEDIDGFEKQRDLLLENPVASAFMDARQQIYDVQDTISSYVSKTFELGRVPMEDELRSGGCCGGGGGGGCGCH